MKKNNPWLSWRDPLVVLLLAGFALRVFLFFMFSPYNHLNEVIAYDAEGYHKLALQLLHQGEFTIQNSDLDTFRTPGYPLFLAGIYKLFGINPSLVLCIQILINLGSVCILYAIGKSIFNKGVGFAMALLLIFELDHIFYIYSLLTDTLFLLFLLLSCLFLFYFLKKHRLLYLILSSVCIGLSTLIRPVSLLFPIVMAGIIVLHSIQFNKWGALVTARHCVLIFLFFGLSLSPWFIRNYSKYGYLKITSISGYNLLDYNVAYAIKKSSNISIHIIRKELDSLVTDKADADQISNPFYKSGIREEVAIDYIKKHKPEYIKANLLGMVNIYLSMEYKSFSHRFFQIKDDSDNNRPGSFDKFAMNFTRFKELPISLIVMAILNIFLLFVYYASAIYGCILLVKEKRYSIVLSVLAIILYFTLITGVVGLARYKLPISPFYIIFSGYGIYTLFQRMNKLNSNYIRKH